MKTRILILSPALDAVSGVSTHVNMLLGSSLADRFELLHFQVGSEGRKESITQRLWRFLVSPLQLAWFIALNRPDLIHINTSMDKKAFFRDLSYLIVSRLFCIKVVNQFHSGSSPATLFGNGVMTTVLRRFLLASDVVSVLSTEALRTYKEFEPRVKVEHVPNAIDATGLLGVTRPNYGVDAPLQLVYVGRIVRSKGLFDALVALKSLTAQGLKFQLRVAGAGSDEDAVRQEIIKLGLENSVSLLGPVFGDAKNQLWLSSEIQLFPTYHNEGLPYSILESLAAGCVPITCAVAAISDVMQDQVHGLFVPPHDPAAIATALTQLASNRADMARMAEAGRERISDHYTVDRLAARFGEIYAKLTDDSSSRRS